MLLAINDRIKGWLGASIVVLIGLPFAFWGIQSYVGGAEERYAAKVDDREITFREFDRDVTVLRQQLARSNPTRVPEITELRRQAMDRIINTSVLELVADRQGYEISDGNLARSIQNLFQTDGKFDPEQFSMMLASNGMTPQAFEFAYRDELRVNQFRDAVYSSAIASDADVRKIIELESQKRDISWLSLNVDKLVSDIAVTDEDINEYYNSHIGEYMTPARVSVEYIELSPDALSDISIDEDMIRSRYDEYVEVEKRREERKARHILITPADGADEARQKIEEIRAELDAGADFAELAGRYSEDTGSAAEGGDLGWVGHGQMVNAFEDALYGLDKGEISDVVETEFGFHLIALDDIRSIEVASLEEKREEITARLRQEAADSMLYDLSEILANAAYENPDSLEPASEALDQPIRTSELFTLDAGTGAAGNESVRAAAFSDLVLKQGENSELIELAPDHVLVLRVSQHIEAAPVPLDTVKTAIAESIRVTRGQQIAADIADDVIEQLKQGATTDAVIRDGIVDEGSLTVSRTETGGLELKLIDEIMSMPAPDEAATTYRRANLANGDVAVVMLHRVNIPENIDDDRIAQTKRQFRQVRAVEEFGAILGSYKEKLSININPKAINRE